MDNTLGFVSAAAVREVPETWCLFDNESLEGGSEPLLKGANPCNGLI